jgi:hypothetical protein
MRTQICHLYTLLTHTLMSALQSVNFTRHQLRRPKHRWEDNITMNCREIECERVEQIQLDQDIANGGLFLT